MEMIGQYIKKKVRKSGIRPSVIYNELHTSSRNLYNIYKRNSVDSEILYSMSKILGVNLFEFYNLKLIEYDPQKFAEPESKFNRTIKRRVMVELELDESEYNELIKKTNR
jgi:hypothetical protein